jgi:RNA polymerase sigma factor (sigma-70 family)
LPASQRGAIICRTVDWQPDLAGAIAGDRDALGRIVTRFYPRVEAQVHRELQQDFRRHHAWILPLFSTSDIVQEVFLSVVQSLGSFVPQDEESLVRYLTTLVKHRLVDAVRHHEADRRDERRRATPPDDTTGITPPAADPTPSMIASVAEQIGLFREVLAGFDERERRLLELRLAGEQPWAAIATQLAYPSEDAARKAFRSAQSRLLVRLRARGMRTEDPD